MAIFSGVMPPLPKTAATEEKHEQYRTLSCLPFDFSSVHRDSGACC